jgi:hypothetical protein
MNPKLKKINDEIEKTKSKITENECKLKELERQKIELENTEIILLVRKIDIPPDEFEAFITAYKENREYKSDDQKLEG